MLIVANAIDSPAIAHFFTTANCSSVTASSRDSVELVLMSGARVKWGDASDSARKAEVLGVLLRQPGRVYDVSAPELPTVRE